MSRESLQGKARLLARLDAISVSLAATGHALALLGLGSVGQELDRLDDYSDLDFFVIVKPGYKQQFIDKLDWMEAVHPVAYRFRNTVDGYKLLFEDGIFCEFAVFEPGEMAHISFASGRIAWKDAKFDEAPVAPALPKSEKPKALDADWQLGEALTNLYVGLGRYQRGEKLSAARFVQGYAVDRLVELSALVESEHTVHKDPFVSERRYEQRFPITAQHLAEFMQGYDRTPESARCILGFLEHYFSVDPHLKAAILRLCDGADEDATHLST